ncbi:hypothetical protein M407DRAFT_26892 [Tulasnella calospora MUT 4182]|uniref:Uncharacterized protein n=1 Tax=Tulasnella calospora MUT 4182 TaxID=1051891 RepID=A0A0C3Q478_9AGAM|nr:hypothetical protein M407DRAFT_26892 [Tulasnella calospora MUT 4182]
MATIPVPMDFGGFAQVPVLVQVTNVSCPPNLGKATTTTRSVAENCRRIQSLVIVDETTGNFVNVDVLKYSGIAEHRNEFHVGVSVHNFSPPSRA